MLDVSLFGLRPPGHHLMNVVLHAGNAVLLFWLLRRWTGCVWRSAMVAALFAWHPLQVESVAWAAERKNTLSTLFWLLTLWSYGAYVRRPSFFRYNATLGVFALGLLAKGMLVTLPCVMILLDYWPLRRLESEGRFHWRRAPRLAGEKLPFFALAVLCSLATFAVQRYGGAVGSIERFTWYARFSNALTAYVIYLAKFVWPAHLAVFYPHPGGSIPWLTAVAAFGLLLMASVAAIGLGKRGPWMPVGWFWYLGTLIPVIGLVQVGDQAYADRYAYVTQIGLYLIAAWAIPAPASKRGRRLMGAAAAGVLAAFALRTAMQIPYWRDSAALFEHAVQVTTDNKFAHLKLGNMWSASRQHEQAVAEYEHALRIDPDYAEAHNNLGVLFLNQNEPEAAAVHFRRALQSNPNHALAHMNLGIALASGPDPGQAIASFKQAVRLAPRNPDVYLNLGLAQFRRGDRSEGIASVRRALELRPFDASAHFTLGVMLEEAGKKDEAMAQFCEVLRLQPGHPGAAPLLQQLR